MHEHGLIRCALAAMVLAACCAGAAADTPPEAPDEDGGALIEQMYGRDIADARRTSDPEDDLAIIKLLFAASREDKNSQSLRLAAIRTALDLLAPLHTNDAADLIAEALTALQTMSDLSACEQAKLRRDVLDARYRAFRRRDTPRADVEEAATDLAEAHLDFAALVVAENNSDEFLEADRSLRTARNLIANLRLTRLAGRQRQLTDTLQRARRRAQRFRDARKRLKQAQQAGALGAINRARTQLARLYLQFDGDLLAAGEHIRGTGDPLEAPVVDAAAFLLNPAKLNADTCLDTIDALSTFAKELDDAPKQVLCDGLYEMCTAYLATEPKGPDATRARLRLAELGAILKLREDEKFLNALSERYGGLHGEMTVIGKGRVRFTYDFKADEQAEDWSVDNGTWGVAGGTLACRTGRGNGAVAHKVRFRTDRPFLLRFKARAAYAIQARLPQYVAGATDASYLNYLNFYRHRTYARAFGAYTRQSGMALKPGQSYVIEAECDGKGSMSWSINDRTVIKADSAESFKKFRKSPMGVHLSTRYTKKRATSFDDVVIEGTPVMPDEE